MTLDHSVMMINQKNNIKIALSNNYMCSALHHPNGKVYQHFERVDICSYDGMKQNSFMLVSSSPFYFSTFSSKLQTSDYFSFFFHQLTVVMQRCGTKVSA